MMPIHMTHEEVLGLVRNDLPGALNIDLIEAYNATWIVLEINRGNFPQITWFFTYNGTSRDEGKFSRSFPGMGDGISESLHAMLNTCPLKLFTEERHIWKPSVQNWRA